jgi:hypothetical protein
MEKDGRQRGFSGISGLVSDLSSLEDSPQNKQPEIESKDDNGRIEPKLGKAHPSDPTANERNRDNSVSSHRVNKSETTSESSQKKSPSTHRVDRSKPESKNTYTPGDKNKSGNSGKWFFAIIGVVFLIWIVNKADVPSNTTRSSSSPSYNPQISKPSSNQSTAQTTKPGINYQIPLVGRNNVLSITEIRWCTKESIRIEAMRNVNTTQRGIDRFNRIVDDYNSRCGEYRYKQGILSRAKRDVEPYRSQIVAEAIREARGYDNPYSPSYSAKTTTPKKTSASTNPSVKLTKEAQRLLTSLGYNPGPIDGLFGRKTSEAIKEFQRNSGIKVDGWVDQDLLTALRSGKAKIKSISKPPPKSKNQTISNRPSSTNPRSSTTSRKYFTRGSHKDDVLRIQGTPDDINEYPSLGYEDLKYGYSTVKISTSSKRVMSWNNNGNLKVHLTPGRNTTKSTYYTRGSHNDDVLRIQGTPDDINSYSSLGYEDWKYGYSTVKISTSTNKVMSWNNNGKLKVRLNPGRNITKSAYYTRRSHKDDVLRIQGTPDDINSYSSLGYEDWKYGYSTVKISTSSNRVMSWNNNGNLKVHLKPGPNTTKSAYFSQGSHKDDILRIQGTPNEINAYSSLGYEDWKYGYSTVKISASTNKVMSWNNNGNLKVQ